MRPGSRRSVHVVFQRDPGCRRLAHVVLYEIGTQKIGPRDAGWKQRCYSVERFSDTRAYGCLANAIDNEVRREHNYCGLDLIPHSDTEAIGSQMSVT